MRQLSLKNQAGVTLLELMTVLTLLAALAGIAAVNSPELLESWRLNSAARQITVDLKRVRVQSIADGTSHRLCFADHASSYRQQRKESRRYKNEGAPISLPAGITIAGCTARNDKVSFHPRGHAGSFGTITIANQKGKQRRVIVNMVGRVRVE